MFNVYTWNDTIHNIHIINNMGIDQLEIFDKFLIFLM